ncbi:piggyBac transposable element-derived protein 4-like [Dermacentor andersoni]|uniref:piggyBac transposable element-derived protein 4-like n=1 Tax=Dermacentor andersoni TaxID=34620 RepID=UPI00215500D8|nr:piggyBac transposable element-derived protein 4-like [Dermacentor andersoni]
MSGERKNLSREEALELYFRLPDKSNDSADEYCDSSDEEDFVLGSTESSEEDDVSPPLPVPTTSKRKKIARKPYSGKRTKPKKVKKLPEGSGDDNTSSQWDTSKFIATIPTNHNASGSQKILERSTAIEAFMLYFDEDVIKHIVDQTNLYAATTNRKRWTTLTCLELRAYLGVLILMSVNRMHHLQMYWCSDSLFHVKEIAQVMTYKRFQHITNCLHLNDNEKMPDYGSKDFYRAYKVRPLIEMMNERFQAHYSPSSHLSVDESMILFKGRSSMKQYMPMKPKIKRGYKVWSLADSETGYLLKFQLYEGKSMQKPEDRTLGEHVVLTLADGAVPAGSQLFFDNFFSSTKLLQELREKDILACGTFRVNKRDLPSEVKVDNKLERGSYIWRKKADVVAYQWRDSKNVHIMSNYHDPESVVQVQRTLQNGKRKEVDCPCVVKEYNAWMGGVDKFDQKRNAYPADRRSKRWWSRIFYFILAAAVVNAFIQISSMSPVTYLQFRLMLGRLLIAQNTFRKSKTTLKAHYNKKGKKNGRAMSGVPDELRFAGNGHHPVLTGKRLRCRWCSTKQKEVRTKYFCKMCNVPLCVTCFGPFHCC